MIELHRPKNDTYSDRIEETLEELVVAHKIHRHPENQEEDRRLPYIKEGDRIVEGKDNLDEYLDRLTNEIRRQRLITSDACYIDPETGEVC